MNLKHLTDNQLLKDTESLAHSEREVSTKLLHHLKEIDVRKLYCDLKCPSLHHYCVRILKLSEADAHRKIQSARLLGDLPEIESKIDGGVLSLTNLAQAASFFKQQDIQTPEDKKEVLTQIENLTKKECEKKLFEISGEEVPAKEASKRLSSEKTKVSLILSNGTLSKLERLKGLLGKSLTQDEVLTKALDVAILNFEKVKFKIHTKEKKSPPPVEVTKRQIPANLKREVYQRKGECENCGSTQYLNYDHKKPYSVGGQTKASNLRLLCFQCNQRARIRAKL